MSEIEILYLVLAVVYLWECACWSPRGAFAFTSWFGTNWRGRHPAAWFGNQKGGFVLGPPLPPLGHMLVSYPLPFSISPEGLATSPGEVPPAIVRFDNIQTLKAKGKKLLINGSPFAIFASPTSALRFLLRLEQLRRLPPKGREGEVRKLLQQAFNTHTIKKRWRHFDLSTRTLRTLANFLFWFLFLFCPVVIWRFGLRLSWPGLVAGLVGLT